MLSGILKKRSDFSKNLTQQIVKQTRTKFFQMLQNVQV